MGLYYQYSKNKGADQLRSYCAADLRLCFRICKRRFSHNAAHLLEDKFGEFYIKTSFGFSLESFNEYP